MEKFKGKYRVASARWPAWDYGRNAAYFITICTANRAPYFGQIVNGETAVTPVGQSARDCWREIPAHFPFVLLGEFVVMPNHVHGIIIINKPDDGDATTPTVETQIIASLPPSQSPDQTQKPKNKFGPQSQNLASIVRGYKIGVTKFARQNDIPFGWQARYHDHVIRTPAEYDRISHYIYHNPQKWADDRYHQTAPS
jgi:REP element-mobilizing transposase RayT